MGTGWTLEGSVSLADQGKAGLRIHVVEDQVATAATLAVLRRMEGHEAHVALDGPAAVEAVQLARSG